MARERVIRRNASGELRVFEVVRRKVFGPWEPIDDFFARIDDPTQYNAEIRRLMGDEGDED
jgi:hypothetical protein